jgi:hypothetical protein
MRLTWRTVELDQQGRSGTSTSEMESLTGDAGRLEYSESQDVQDCAAAGAMEDPDSLKSRTRRRW